MGFDLILFESGYGDAEHWLGNNLTPYQPKNSQVFLVRIFTIKSEEIENLVSYVKSQNGKLKIQGFDCQPQQNYLIKRMSEIAQPLDSILAKSVPLEMRSFNNLYQYENDKDTSSFNIQRDRFIEFLINYTTLF